MQPPNTIKNVFLYAVIGTSATIAPFSYEFVTPSLFHDYKEIGDPIVQNFICNTDETQLKLLIGVSENIITNSQNIDQEFVDIVNESFWDLI